MRAAWIEEWGGDLRYGERADPTVGDSDVLVAVEACGIGRTVLNYMRGDLGQDPADLPRIPGHELVGRVVDTGASVDPRRRGERAMAYFYLFCGACRRCLAGTESLCERLAGYLGVARDGGYSELTVVPARNMIPLPNGLDAAAATAIPDAIATPVHIAHRAAIHAGERVAVVGAGGGVGIHMVQVAQLFGAEVAGLDAFGPKLRYLSDELGVDAIDSSDFEAARLPATWDGGADVVVDLLGSPASLEWSAQSLRGNGRLVVVTTFRDVGFTASPRQLVLSQTCIVGSRYASRWELELAARLVASGRIRPVVTRSVGLEELSAAHDELRRGALLGRGALLWD